MSTSLESSIARLKSAFVTYIDRRVVLSARPGGKGDGVTSANEVANFLRDRHGPENVMVIVKDRMFMPFGMLEGKVDWNCASVQLWPCDQAGSDGHPTLPPPLKTLVQLVNAMSEWMRISDNHVVALFEPSIACACAIMVKLRRSRTMAMAENSLSSPFSLLSLPLHAPRSYQHQKSNRQADMLGMALLNDTLKIAKAVTISRVRVYCQHSAVLPAGVRLFLTPYRDSHWDANVPCTVNSERFRQLTEFTLDPPLTTSEDMILTIMDNNKVLLSVYMHAAFTRITKSTIFNKGDLDFLEESSAIESVEIIPAQNESSSSSDREDSVPIRRGDDWSGPALVMSSRNNNGLKNGNNILQSLTQGNIPPPSPALAPRTLEELAKSKGSSSPGGILSSAPTSRLPDVAWDFASLQQGAHQGLQLPVPSDKTWVRQTPIKEGRRDADKDALNEILSLNAMDWAKSSSGSMHPNASRQDAKSSDRKKQSTVDYIGATVSGTLGIATTRRPVMLPNLPLGDDSDLSFTPLESDLPSPAHADPGQSFVNGLSPTPRTRLTASLFSHAPPTSSHKPDAHTSALLSSAMAPALPPRSSSPIGATSPPPPARHSVNIPSPPQRKLGHASSVSSPITVPSPTSDLVPSPTRVMSPANFVSIGSDFFLSPGAHHDDADFFLSPGAHHDDADIRLTHEPQLPLPHHINLQDDGMQGATRRAESAASLLGETEESIRGKDNGKVGTRANMDDKSKGASVVVAAGHVDSRRVLFDSVRTMSSTSSQSDSEQQVLLAAKPHDAEGRGAAASARGQDGLQQGGVMHAHAHGVADGVQIEPASPAGDVRQLHQAPSASPVYRSDPERVGQVAPHRGLPNGEQHVGLTNGAGKGTDHSGMEPHRDKVGGIGTTQSGQSGLSGVVQTRRVSSPDGTLSARTHWCPCLPIGSDTSAADAHNLQMFLDTHMGVLFSEHYMHELYKLWNISFPLQPNPPRTGKCWKRLGFQGEDPSTDIRGIGMLSIRLMNALAERHPSLHARLVARAEMDYDQKNGGYPFACAGVNVASLLIEALNLTKTGDTTRKSSPEAAKCLAKVRRMMAAEDTSFFTLFAATFAELDKEWTKASASYMMFSSVIKTARQNVMTALLSSQVTTVYDLVDKLGVQLS